VEGRPFDAGGGAGGVSLSLPVGLGGQIFLAIEAESAREWLGAGIHDPSSADDLHGPFGLFTSSATNQARRETSWLEKGLPPTMVSIRATGAASSSPNAAG